MVFVAKAQFPMVTLSHNGELSFFTNMTAFEAAIDSAKNGDTLYLSEGNFMLNGGKITIQKRLNIVGSGYGSHIIGKLYIDLRNNTYSFTGAPLFEGVYLDTLEFPYYGSETSADDNLRGESEIRRCRIRTLMRGANADKYVTYDKCFLESANFDGYGSVVVKNSKIIGHNYSYDDEWLDLGDAIYNITAINCNISEAYHHPTMMNSCIFQASKDFRGNKFAGIGQCSIFNSVIEFIPTDSNVYTYDCYIHDDKSKPLLDENMECPLDLIALGYIGQDGTVAGINGGYSPFSENPSVPTVDSANSSVLYDAQSNKLKVSIAVKAN